MSNIYIKEPPTHGKVLLKTTLGDIDVELWSKEAPLACRNIVQLCLEEYYNGTIFHRIIKDFIAQGGDPTGTGEGGESVYGHPFKDEFHSRLKFTRRGLVAMANGGPDDNGSQFFFTLGRADELSKKHTVFGKVTGDTLYNMIRLNDIPTDKEDRPMDPAPRIIKTSVLMNPFDDIVPRVDKRKLEKSDGKVKSQSRATKNFSLLSFGEEAEEDEEETAAVSTNLKIKSSHDVLTEDPRLSSQPVLDSTELAEVSDKRRKGEEGADNENEGEMEYDAKMRERVRQRLKRTAGERLGGEKADGQGEEEEEEEDWDDMDTRKRKRREEVRRETEQLRRELKEAKRRKDKDETEKAKEDSLEDLPEPIRALRQQQAMYKSKKAALGKGGTRELQTLELLTKFKSRMFTARHNTTGDSEGVGEVEGEKRGVAEGGGGEDENNERKYEGKVPEENWLGHYLSFEEERLVVAKDASVQNEDTFDIYDPRNPLNKRRREENKKHGGDREEGRSGRRAGRRREGD